MQYIIDRCVCGVQVLAVFSGLYVASTSPPFMCVAQVDVLPNQGIFVANPITSADVAQLHLIVQRC